MASVTLSSIVVFGQEKPQGYSVWASLERCDCDVLVGKLMRSELNLKVTWNHSPYLLPVRGQRPGIQHPSRPDSAAEMLPFRVLITLGAY
jgi:hypothetical protein